MASGKVPVTLIDRGEYYCPSCDHDPIKPNGQPHCLECGSHHPLHKNCAGEIIHVQIPYVKLFYSNPGMFGEIGVA